MCTHPECFCDRVRDVLRDVEEPELKIGIVDLGLVCSVEAGPAGVQVRLTMTSPTSRLTATLVESVEAALARQLPEAGPVKVDVVWEPPWTPWRMSERARRHFGWTP